MELSQTLEGLTEQQGQILKAMEGLTERVEQNDSEAKAQLKTLSEEMAEVAKEREAKQAAKDAADAKAMIEEWKDRIERAPSKAGVIGNREPGPPTTNGFGESFGFFTALAAAKSLAFPQDRAAGKAYLDSIGYDIESNFQQPVGKATLGDTGAAGGNLVPANVLGPVIEIATATNPYRQLLTVVNAGFVGGVDIPAESLAPARATVQAYGATKTNVNLTVGKYTATMYTLAKIYDLGNQLLRNSRGAAEQLVRDALTRSIALGEAYYILQGSGTSEPKGILTSIGTTGTWVTSFTASATTLAGSSASAIAKATGVLANRARQPDGVVVNASDFWIMAAQGTDSAGFFFSPAGGPTQINPTQGQLRVWGLPVYADPNMPTDSMVVGEWKSAQLFTGQTFRVDVSDQAGARWDTNETGFRGEEEIGFTADPYVDSGIFQRVTDFTP